MQQFEAFWKLLENLQGNDCDGNHVQERTQVSESFSEHLFMVASKHWTETHSGIKNPCVRSLGQDKYDWNLRLCTVRNKSLLDEILKIVISNNSSSQADFGNSGLVKEKYLA